MCWTSYVNLLRNIWYFGNISAFGHYYDLVRKEKKKKNLIEHIKVLQWPAQKLWSSCRTTSWDVWVAKQRNIRLFAAFLPDNGSFAWLWAFFISLLSILMGSKQACCFIGCNTSKKPSQKMRQNWSERGIYKVFEKIKLKKGNSVHHLALNDMSAVTSVTLWPYWWKLYGPSWVLRASASYRR